MQHIGPESSISFHFPEQHILPFPRAVFLFKTLQKRWQRRRRRRLRRMRWRVLFVKFKVGFKTFNNTTLKFQFLSVPLSHPFASLAIDFISPQRSEVTVSLLIGLISWPLTSQHRRPSSLFQGPLSPSSWLPCRTRFNPFKCLIMRGRTTTVVEWMNGVHHKVQRTSLFVSMPD